MKVLVIGADGQLGRAMVERLSPHHEVRSTTISDLDICDHPAVSAVVREARPDAIVNCAAFTDVDGAEDHPVETLNINAFAVQSLAQCAAASSAALVHFSTDFVFDGRATTPYTEEDRPGPRSTYACSKLIGEWFAREAGRCYVLRVESLFGGLPVPGQTRRTSVDRIVDSVLAGAEARVFVDRTVSPSYTRDVVDATRSLLEREAPTGLYHCVNSGLCTWYELGCEVGRILGIEPKLQAVPVADVRMKAERPQYCALSNAKLAAAGVTMPSWQDALARYVQLRMSRPA